MRKRFIVSIVLALLGSGILSAKSIHPYYHFKQGNERKVIRDKREMRHDNREVRGDRRELNKDRAVRNAALQTGHNGLAAEKQHEVNKDKRELRRDKRERREDRRDLHEDIKK